VTGLVSSSADAILQCRPPIFQAEVGGGAIGEQDGAHFVAFTFQPNPFRVGNGGESVLF